MKASPPANSDTPGTPPAVTVVDFTDPTALGEAVELIQMDAVQLESKPLRVQRVVVRLGASVVMFHSTNRSVRTRTRVQPGFVSCTAFGPRAAGTMNGLPISPDRLLTCVPGIEVEFVVAAGYESVAFLLPPDHIRGRDREGEFRPSTGVEFLAPSPAAAQGLYAWGRSLTDTAARQSELFDRPQVQSAAQVELLETLLSILGSATRTGPAPEELTRQAHSRVVQVAEDYALSHTAERVHLTDLCEAAGVSERTLQYAFREVMGMTPVAYLTGSGCTGSARRCGRRPTARPR
jgi:hypothetical protein